MQSSVLSAQRKTLELFSVEQNQGMILKSNVTWMRVSVLLSTAEVASSRTRTLESRRSARARQTSCRSPTLRFEPFSLISCSSFFSKPETELLRKYKSQAQNSKIHTFKCASLSASQIRSSVASLKGSRFSRKVPLNKTGSCGMIVSLFLKS